MKGYFPCNNCRICRESKTKKTNKFKSNVTGKEYEIKNFISCHTKGVIYLLTCECGQQYVGRTIRTGCKRVGEHLTNIRKGFLDHSLSKHFSIQHHRNPKNLEIVLIEKYVPHWRGSNLKRTVSRREVFWIHELKCFQPNGHNIEWDINSYINNKWISGSKSRIPIQYFLVVSYNLQVLAPR